jgi:ABC-2 type transport system permease protein
MKGNFENSLKLARFILRRERIISTVWIALLVLVVVGLVPLMNNDNVMDADSRAAVAGMMEAPSMVSMMGPAYVLVAPESFGALYTNLMMLLTALTVGIMNIFLVVRHTRADEEQGRYEVVRSLPTGRLANLNATMLSAVVVNIILSIVMGLGMYALGDAGMDFNGSMLWGASLGAAGLVFAAIAALFSQLSFSSGGAKGYSFALLAIIYFLRAPGDMDIRVVNGEVITGSAEFLSLISPLGLVLRTRAYCGDFWWPVWALTGAAVILSAAAYYFNAIRDIDQGIIPARAGRVHGSFLMKSPHGLAFKILRASLIGWVIGMFALGAAYGTVLEEIDEFIAHNDVWQSLMIGPTGIEVMNEAGFTSEQIVEVLRSEVAKAGYTLPQLFMSAITSIMGIFAFVPLLVFLLRAKKEEEAIRTELILATPVSRYRYLAGYTVIAFAMAVVIQLILAYGLYAVGTSVMSNPEDLTLAFLLEANMVFIPALWAMLGLTVLLIGLKPKFTGIIWGYFALAFILMFFGSMGIFPDWLAYLTPMGFVPRLPMDEINFLTLGLLTLAAAVLTAAGMYFYTKRDINAITH